jgi:hypothetical protein
MNLLDLFFTRGFTQNQREDYEILRARKRSRADASRIVRTMPTFYWGALCPECGLPCSACSAIGYFVEAWSHVVDGDFEAAREQLQSAEHYGAYLAPTIPKGEAANV